MGTAWRPSHLPPLVSASFPLTGLCTVPPPRSKRLATAAGRAQTGVGPRGHLCAGSQPGWSPEASWEPGPAPPQGLTSPRTPGKERHCCRNGVQAPPRGRASRASLVTWVPGCPLWTLVMGREASVLEASRSFSLIYTRAHTYICARTHNPWMGRRLISPTTSPASYTPLTAHRSPPTGSARHRVERKVPEVCRDTPKCVSKADFRVTFCPAILNPR